MIRGVVSWIKAGFLVLVGLLMLTAGIEPIYSTVVGDDAVKALGWDAYATSIWNITLDIGIWIFAVGMFFLSAIFILRRQKATTRRRP